MSILLFNVGKTKVSSQSIGSFLIYHKKRFRDLKHLRTVSSVLEVARPCRQFLREWQTLDHLGVESGQPHIASAGGPLICDGYDAQAGEGAQIEPDLDMAAKPAPDEEVDQRVSW
jgi:hypothetical protein